MKITQIKISPSMLADKFIKHFKLSDYTDINAPTLFMGCYIPPDYETIIKHRGFGIIRWCGTDAMRFNLYAGYINAVKEKLNIKHIAISDYIARDLDNIGIKYLRFPCTTVKKEMNPVSLGDSVYCYLPASQYERYGGLLVDEIRKKTKHNFIITNHPRQFTTSELNDIYRRSFIGLRLTQHDGLPSTVLELGLMGRRSVFNGGLPHTLHWSKVEKIVKIIEMEKKRNPGVKIVARDMYNYINIERYWLNTEFWDGR